MEGVLGCDRCEGKAWRKYLFCSDRGGLGLSSGVAAIGGGFKAKQGSEDRREKGSGQGCGRWRPRENHPDFPFGICSLRKKLGRIGPARLGGRDSRDCLVTETSVVTRIWRHLSLSWIDFLTWGLDLRRKVGKENRELNNVLRERKEKLA